MNCLSPHDSYCTLPIHIITVQGQRRELGMVTQRFTVLCDTVNPNGSFQQKRVPFIITWKEIQNTVRQHYRGVWFVKT